MERKFNLLPDPLDERDFKFKATQYTNETLPESVDLVPFFPPIVDQYYIGACTGNGLAGFLAACIVLSGDPMPPDLARLYIYFHELLMDGSLPNDVGSYPRTGMKVLAKGVPPEYLCPYIVEKFADSPSQEAENAATYKLREYHRVTSSIEILHALAQRQPVAFGATVYESLYSVGKDGIIPMPTPGDRILGGHFFVGCGYKDYTIINDMTHVRVRNTWGPEWGDNGYAWMPIAYIKSIDVTDMWTGVSKISYENFSLEQALNTLGSHKKIDSPDLWREVLTAVAAGKFHPALQYLPLFFRKWGADVENQ